MAVVRTHVDHDRPLQPAIEQFGYAIGLVVMRTIGPGERPDCPCLAHRVPESPLHHRPGQMRLDMRPCRLGERGPARGFGHQSLNRVGQRSEEHTSELQSLMRISYAVFCLKKKTHKT